MRDGVCSQPVEATLQAVCAALATLGTFELPLDTGDARADVGCYRISVHGYTGQAEQTDRHRADQQAHKASEALCVEDAECSSHAGCFRESVFSRIGSVRKSACRKNAIVTR
jgi:hypothetical protein